VLDNHLHNQRIGANCSKRTYRANLDDLPDGVFVVWEGHEGIALLLWQNHLFTWSPAGYRSCQPRPRAESVPVLTPESTVEAIRAGYVPEIHPTARLGSSSPKAKGPSRPLRTATRG
jgi:hypothetical protein